MSTRLVRVAYFPDTNPQGEEWRLRVEFDPEWGLAVIADEKMASVGGEQVSVATTLELTEEEVRWTHSALGELVAMWDGPPPPSKPTPWCTNGALLLGWVFDAASDNPRQADYGKKRLALVAKGHMPTTIVQQRLAESASEKEEE